jgi:hypothetical protein
MLSWNVDSRPAESDISDRTKAIGSLRAYKSPELTLVLSQSASSHPTTLIFVVVLLSFVRVGLLCYFPPSRVMYAYLYSSICSF